MKQCLPKKNGTRRTGCWFGMAFVYLPTGTQIFTGDYGSIQKLTENLPTSHGWIIPYRGGQQDGGVRARMFGKHTSFKQYPRIDLIRHRSKKGDGTRSHWELVETTKTRDKIVLATYRKLPKQHLRILRKVTV